MQRAGEERGEERRREERGEERRTEGGRGEEERQEGGGGFWGIREHKRGHCWWWEGERERRDETEREGRQSKVHGLRRWEVEFSKHLWKAKLAVADMISLLNLTGQSQRTSEGKR